jgi:hypothetical protein
MENASKLLLIQQIQIILCAVYYTVCPDPGSHYAQFVAGIWLVVN